ncbi:MULTISPECIES: hypothetical protein [unclassified Streptomyces]|uniref:hypothetical protein n=1 Tax=unclassified Streptomyces TaxID=2593676 RepID=UPI002E36A677|nr:MULTISPECIES: hypothetical protein [unclassified Streptomyces]WUC67958.1 hypothetical protein OG861_29045 [Streptomyces sp. NBC_00539]
MDALVFNVTTAALMVVMFKGALALLGEDTLRRRPTPWAAMGLTALVIAGLVTQLCWSGAMDAFGGDPSKTGWWRPVTSVFMQNGGLFGDAWNLATIAVIAALAEWFWGGPLMLALFAAGILLPTYIDTLFGESDRSTDPRNFAGSSGATYFLAATLAAPLLLRALRAGRSRTGTQQALLALGVPVLGLAMWFAQSNGHGLVAVYGSLLGALACLLPRSPEAPRPAAPLNGPAERGPAERSPRG